MITTRLNLREKIGVKPSKREKKDRYKKINRDESDKKLRRSRSRLRSHSRKQTQDKNVHGIERIQRTSKRRNYRGTSHRKYSREGSTKIEDLKISSAKKQDGCNSTKKSSKSVGGSTRLGVDKNSESGVSSNTSTMIKQRLAKIEFLQSRYKLRENLKKYMAEVIQDIKENTGGIKDRDPVKMGKVKILRKRLLRLRRQLIKVTNTLLEKDSSENSGSNGTASRPVKLSTVTSAGSTSLQTVNKSKDGVSKTFKSSKNKKSPPVDKIAVKNNKMVMSPKEVTIAKETSSKMSKKDRSTVVFQTSTNSETQKEESQIETGLKLSENVVVTEKSKNLENKHSAAANKDTVSVDSSDAKENEADCPKSKPEENSCSSKDFSKEIIVNVVQSSTNSGFEKKESQTTELLVSGKLIEAATFEDSKNSSAPAEKRTVLVQSSYDKISSTEKIPGDNHKTNSGISANKIARKSSKKEQKSDIKEIAFTDSGGKEQCAAIDVRVNENSMDCSSKQILQENFNIERKLIIYLTNIACQKDKLTKTFGSGKEFNDESLRHPQIEKMKHGALSTEGRKRKLNGDKTLVVRLQRFFHNEEQKKDSNESISKTDDVKISVPKKRGGFVKRRPPTDMNKMSGKRNSNGETEKLEESNFSNTKPEPNQEVIFVDESSDEETSVTFISKEDLIAHKDDNSEEEVENTNVKIRLDLSTDDDLLDTEGDSAATNVSRRDIGKSKSIEMKHDIESNVAKNKEESYVIKESTSKILLSKGKKQNTPSEKSDIPEEVNVIDRNILSHLGKKKSDGIEVEINEETPFENSTLGTNRDNCNESTSQDSQVETKEITAVTKKTPAPIEDVFITGTSITSSIQKYPLEKVHSSNINIGSFETNEVSESTKSGVDMQQKTSQALSENEKAAKDSKSVSIEEAKNIISQVCSIGTVETTQDLIISTETQIKPEENTGEPKDAHLELLVGTEKKNPNIPGSSTKSDEKSGVREEIKSIIQCKKKVLESSDSQTKSDIVEVPDENISEVTNILNKNIAGDSIEFDVNPVESNDSNDIGTEIKKKYEINKRKCTVEKEGLEIIGDDVDADITSGTTKFNKKTEEPNKLVANETIPREESPASGEKNKDVETIPSENSETITKVEQIVKSSVEIISENSSEMEDSIVCSKSTSEMKTKVDENDDEIKLNGITIIPEEKITDNEEERKGQDVKNSSSSESIDKTEINLAVINKISLEVPTQSESMIDIDLITVTKEANSTGTEETPGKYKTVTEQSLREENKPDSDG